MLSHFTGRSSALAAPHIFSNYKCIVFRASDKLHQGKHQPKSIEQFELDFVDDTRMRSRCIAKVYLFAHRIALCQTNAPAIANRRNEGKNNFRGSKKSTIRLPMPASMRKQKLRDTIHITERCESEAFKLKPVINVLRDFKSNFVKLECHGFYEV